MNEWTAELAAAKCSAKSLFAFLNNLNSFSSVIIKQTNIDR